MKLTLLLFLFGLTAFLPAQPTLQWQRCFGGSMDDHASKLCVTSDHGYMAFGTVFSKDGDITTNQGQTDTWAIKMDSMGGLQWQRTYGGSSFDEGTSIRQTADGGYILAGSTRSNDGDVFGNHGHWDCWAVKLNPLGEIDWQRALGGTKEDRCYAVEQATDGGYIIAGYSRSSDGDLTSNYGFSDYWAVKLSASGAIEWQKNYGGSGDDECYEVRLTNDGGYVLMGATFSFDGDVTENHGDIDYWVVKINSIGELEWQTALGGAGADDGRFVIQTTDGGYLVGGTDGSSSGQVIGGYLYTDYWVVKLNANGAFQWQKPLGGNGLEYLSAIIESEPGKYLMCGVTESSDGDVVGNNGGANMWLVEIDESGAIQWQKILGGSGYDYPNNLEKEGNGIILLGSTNSNDGDILGNHGNYDLWVAKLNFEPSITEEPGTGLLEISPNPAKSSIKIEVPESGLGMTVALSDYTGRIVLKKDQFPNGGSIDLGHLPSGMYIVKAASASGKVYMGKVLKI